MEGTVTREQLDRMVGERLGVSDWFLIDQERVNRFADVTLDHQFVHVDPVRAQKQRRSAARSRMASSRCRCSCRSASASSRSPRAARCS